MFEHYSVLLTETINSLNIKDSGTYVDATMGGAGHSQKILDLLGPDGRLICFDQDDVAIEHAQKTIGLDPRVTIIKSNFCFLKNELSKIGVFKIDGIVFDLGVSSVQIDTDERGFSYINEGPLDMRMDQNMTVTAQDIIMNYSEQQLTKIFRDYGEEKLAAFYAKAIVKARTQTPFTTTKQLSDFIIEVMPKKLFYKSTSHPAIRVFQALRIEVNKELDVFEQTVTDSFELLNVGGRISVITFHSLEDRICQKFFKQVSRIDSQIAKLPVIPEEYKPSAKIVSNKPILPTEAELAENSRSRSAKLRVLERVKA